jgi:NADH:ubiquinone oxidoreductase subunit 3 (subunit A)
LFQFAYFGKYRYLFIRLQRIALLLLLVVVVLLLVVIVLLLVSIAGARENTLERQQERPDHGVYAAGSKPRHKH